MRKFTEAKKNAREAALAEISTNGITEQLFIHLDAYYENDFSEFGEFSNIYGSLKKLTLGEKITQMTRILDSPDEKRKGLLKDLPH